ncbi:hypothetical protein ACLOJK_011153 [Asimina triloba]
MGWIFETRIHFRFQNPSLRCCLPSPLRPSISHCHLLPAASRLLYPATADPVLPPVSSSTANPALPPVSSVTHLLTCQRDPVTADGNNPFLCLQPRSGHRRLLCPADRTNLSPCLPMRSGRCRLLCFRFFPSSCCCCCDCSEDERCVFLLRESSIRNQNRWAPLILFSPKPQITNMSFSFPLGGDLDLFSLYT